MDTKETPSDTKIVSNDTKKSIESLKFVPLKIPRLIPSALIEAVKGRTFTTEQFYVYQEKQIDNIGNFLFALIDPDKKIQGFLWAELNALDNTLYISTFSIAKEYWGKGAGITKAIEFVQKLKDKTNSPRVLWCTSNERFFAKHGFSKAKQTLMEYNSN